MKEEKDRRFTIGIMFGDAQSDYSEELLQGFFSSAREENVNLIFLMGPQIPDYCEDILACNLYGDYNYQFDTVYEYTRYAQLDALIITYGSLSMFHCVEDKQAFLDHFSKVPCMVLEDTSEIMPYMIADNYNGMRSCVEHLVIDHGYRKIAFLGGPKSNRDSNERLQAYRDVMEEHHLPVTEDMVAYGNYTEQVERQAESFLERIPGLEAIVCANDNMAKGCYRVCHDRGIRIGKDIAITGFDNVDIARVMTPPLTTVAQSSFRVSYTALKKAIRLCEGKQIESCRTSTVLQKRSSCGCRQEEQVSIEIAPDKLKAYILEYTDRISEDLLGGIPYPKEREYYAGLIREYFNQIYQEVFENGTKEIHTRHLTGILREFVRYPHVSSVWLFERFSGLFRILIANANDLDKQKRLAEILNISQQYIHSCDRLEMEERMKELTRKAWFVPSFTRDLTRRGSREDYSEVLLPLMERMKMMQVKSCYFYFFEEPVIYKRGIACEFPDSIWLAAWYDETGMCCYPTSQRPVAGTQKGFAGWIPSGDSGSKVLTSFILFSEEKQYGVMLCEVERTDISFLQICGLQIGSLLRYLELNWMEKEAKDELEESLKVIREQNHILSFISEYDELTKLLNRRGFMERAIRKCKEYDGYSAYMIFGDLDHLKEINDCFGHAAGDIAIRGCAERMRTALPKDSVIARIGGDEFVAMSVSQMPGFDDAVRTRMQELGREYNDTSKLPYYVELSIGIYPFSCEPGINLPAIMKKSDALLYEAKKCRRASIRK